MITATWKPLDPDVEAFITEFQRRGDDPDADTGEQFAEQFLNADPTHAGVVTRDMLVAALPARRKIFEKAGVAGLRRVATSQLDLDARHLLVTTDWDADRPGQPSLRLESTFLVRRESHGLCILVYLNHHDIVALLSHP